MWCGVVCHHQCLLFESVANLCYTIYADVRKNVRHDVVARLLIMSFDGVDALPWELAGGDSAASSRKSSTSRALIEVIRRKDTEALIEAIDAGINPNRTDDVGQTLLNWASAFGTLEMVQHLCDKGADVNQGRRSSSLIYAACFGRVKICSLLLQNGADPTLLDENGKNAVEKAQEKSHKECIKLLKNPPPVRVRDSSGSSSGGGGAAAAVEGVEQVADGDGNGNDIDEDEDDDDDDAAEAARDGGRSSSSSDEDFDADDAKNGPLLTSTSVSSSLTPTPTSVAVPRAKSKQRAIHPGVICDLSGMSPIIGTRYHKIGEDFDVCETEFKKLPVAEKAKYESIVRPGAVPIPIVQEMATSEDAAKRAAGRLATAVSAGCTPQKDPEAASSVVAVLLPSIIHAHRATMNANVSKRILKIFVKIILYATPKMLNEVFASLGDGGGDHEVGGAAPTDDGATPTAVDADAGGKSLADSAARVPVSRSLSASSAAGTNVSLLGLVCMKQFQILC